ncbi:MAG: hypothetical protein A2X56_06290 [Nitrospirae bacterium GWC2_57_13]|nr:MAG: hypothetical protein A2X56_06290 [Nitrospirae bacterium GWC2_57_13]
MLLDLERQRGAWLSAKEMIKQKKIVYRPEYEKAVKEMEEHDPGDDLEEGARRASQGGSDGTADEKGGRDVYITKELVDEGPCRD